MVKMDAQGFLMHLRKCIGFKCWPLDAYTPICSYIPRLLPVMLPLGFVFGVADAGRVPEAADVGREPEVAEVGRELTSEDGFRADGVVHTSVYILSTLSISKS